jgi:voltage-gated potassium channel
MNAKSNEADNRMTGFQVLMLVLSIYVLGALFVETAFKLPSEVSSLLSALDTAICFLFIWDFFYRLYRAEDRRAFLRWGWVDLVSSIPMLEVFRWGRLVRVIRILRILRGVRSTKVIINTIFDNRAKGTFSAVALISAVLVIFSTLAILNAETAPEANIKNAGDALWWAVATITTVGYGDKYPLSTEGRIIAAVLMTAGVGLFGTFTAYVASFFAQSRKRGDETEPELVTEIRLLRERMESLEAKLSSSEVKHPAQFGPAAIQIESSQAGN